MTRLLTLRQCTALHRRGAWHFYWRNLDLLLRLLAHPHEELRRAAEERLRQMLPKGSRPTAEWVREHRDTLRWDATTERFLKNR
ncbi:MAG: hypothetical protein JNM84_08045 [Planctomycetes bacterium]|nr:hypothetical protein [Planctomycetota bacterium]